jgi:hypothetical protein
MRSSLAGSGTARSLRRWNAAFGLLAGSQEAVSDQRRREPDDYRRAESSKPRRLIPLEALFDRITDKI